MSDCPKLLLVDGYDGEGAETTAFLRDGGYAVKRVDSERAALDALRGGDVPCVITAARVRATDGTALLGGISVVESVGSTPNSR